MPDRGCNLDAIRAQHTSDLTHHIQQGQAWLAASNCGENTAMLSYAALELRLAIERLAIHYWTGLLDRPLTDEDLRDFESFSRGQRRIFAEAGHQQLIDAHFAFMRIVLNVLNVETPLCTPNMGELARHWQISSNCCHIAWTLGCNSMEVRSAAFEDLSTISGTLSVLVGGLGWPVLKDAEFMALRDRFVAGQALSDDVHAELKRRGIWAQVEYPDGRPSHFVGDPLPPDPA